MRTGTAVMPAEWGATEIFIGKVVAIGTGVYAIWRGAKYGVQVIRKAWRVISEFANSLDALEKVGTDVAIIRARQAVIVEMSPSPFWAADAQGRITDANAALLRLMGVPLSEFVGSGWESHLHRADADAVIRAWNETVKEAAIWNRIYRVRNAYGETMKVQVKAMPVCDPRGNVVEYQGTTTVLSRKPSTEE